MDVIFRLLCFAFFISIKSPCLGMLRKHCDIIEQEYFDIYNTRTSLDFDGFDKLNFSLAAACKSYNTSVIDHLEEVPVETDWLYLEIFNVHVKAQAFSHLTNLSYVYISGNFVISPVVFQGLKKLSVLWLRESQKHIIEELDLGGLCMLQELQLRDSPFSSLNKSIFDNLHQLKHLILYENCIETLSSVTQYLPKLQSLEKLSLFNNNITAYRETDCLFNEHPTGNITHIHFNITYLNIDGIQATKLENNSFCNFPRLSFFKPDIDRSVLKSLKSSGIQKVDSISFSYSQISTFHICVYVSLFQIQELQLTNNHIKFIHTSNGSCNALRIVDLSFNYIEHVAASQMKRLRNLKELNLSNNKIISIKICSENLSMELVSLNLASNYLTSLTQDQFKCLKQLKELSLNDNKIQAVAEYSFRGMKNLEVLHLDNNNIYSLGELAFGDLFSLKQLTMNENFLEHIDDWAFRDLTMLEEIALGFNYMVPMWWSKTMKSLKKMSMKTLDTSLTIESNFFNNFPSFESLSIDSHVVLIDSCDDFPFSKVKELYLRNIGSLLCYSPEFHRALEQFTNLESLHLIAAVSSPSERDIFHSSLENLTKLTFFHIENTNVLDDGSALNVHKLFLGLKNLEILHLVNSGIEDYGKNVLFKDLKSVTSLMIENEKIYKIPDNVFSDMVSLKYVFFPKTSFSCNCDLSWLTQWMTYEKQVVFLGFYDNFCFVNAQIQPSHLVSFLEDKCNTELGFIAFIATLVSTLIFMCISLFYESIWWYLLYMFYTIKCWLNNRQRIGDHYEYDVFVSYNAHNEQWVTEQLLPNLEQNGPPFFKVCIHNRDFEIGRDIVDNIVDSMYSSRRTICVITRSYLQSSWCSLEIRMATYRLVAESKDSLILIFLDNIPREELQLHHRLTKILDKKTYLKWPEDGDEQQLFWARLRKVIAGHT
ncbi:uncharacterized protein RB166_018592 [Leptodactylus fuscus]|uniref:uncharacterized protein LOC142219379 n=1 Tax=Leptodactylus fuscus TaxID=238119 RepID=UPI003F4F2007